MAISAISLDDLLCVKVLDEGVNVNAEEFIDFLNVHLAPTLQPFNGHNSRSVVVLGNDLILESSLIERL